MRLVHLSVKRFQCIESAEVEFGPGLNVLYGPNDLGKSSLAWAIRGVLLLQHDSKVHERFVSWYGDGEPRVALTLCDDDNRLWRVTKTFSSGTAGRSILEGSRDGRTFTADSSGRQVDEKLRTMFGWGVQQPGGKGGPRGLPESFLTQVLLAEQDSVRNVLFDTSLAKDPDEAGRLRLVEALGALAQDPIFKCVLDQAQESVDKAFTPKGRKKRTAGSPYVEIAERLTAMQHDHDELSQKVRETEAAEAKILELNGERDKLHLDRDEAVETLTTTRRRFESRLRRDRLHGELEAHLATVRGVEVLQRTVDASEVEISRLKEAVEAGAVRVRETTTAVERDEAVRNDARRRLDALTHEDAEHERRTRDLEEHKKTAVDQLDAADRAVERARTELHQARAIVNEVAGAAVAAAENALRGKTAEDGAAAALAELGRAQQAHADATQRVRDASSDDRARARELEQKELENRRLTRVAQRVTIERDLQRAAAVGEVVRKADTARAATVELATKVSRARGDLASEETKLVSVDAASAILRQLDTFGQLLQLRGAAEAASQVQASAVKARAAAATLRQQETELRAKISPGLPAAEAIAALRDLREKRRTADARLGGGISVTVRPKQPIALTAIADGLAVPAVSAGEPVVLSANQVLLIGLGDLVDLEVTAGEEGARKAAAALRERWNREGSRMLADHGVDTVEQLEALRRDADTTLRAAEQCQRDAAHEETRASHVPVTGDPAEEFARLAELEAELGDANHDELATRFTRLGDRWQSALKRQVEENTVARSALLAELDQLRGQLTRLQTQFDGQAQEADTLEHEAALRQAELSDRCSVLVARHKQELGEVDRDLDALVRHAAVLSGGASDDQQEAEKRLTAASRALDAAANAHRSRQADRQSARDAVVAATTKLEGARTRARDLDVNAVWATDLALLAPVLSLITWQGAVTAAEELHEQRKAARDAAEARLVQLSAGRASAIQRARAAAAAAEQIAVGTRSKLGALQAEQEAVAANCSKAQVAAAESKVQLARANVDDARRAIVSLREQLAALGDVGSGTVDAEDVAYHESAVERLDAHLREAQEELARARGGLEQVGGAIVRERLRELDTALRQARERERQIEVEFEAWKMLVETLRASESTEGAHLGRALAGPVSARFHQLTGGRYGGIEFGAHLEAAGLQAAGELREISALSAGTQDQLATLLRLCIAEQLHSAIVLDDHLSQSDPARVAWFNAILRTAAQQVQIILITCRPAELLGADEFPRKGEPSFTGAAGLIRSVDLGNLIRRFASATVAKQRSEA